MTISQHSTFPSADDPRGVVDPDLVDAFRKLSTLKADYETMRLNYMLDCLLPFFNAWRVADGIEPAPIPIRPPVVLEELVALRKEYEALEAWKAELEAACNDEPQPQKQRKPTLAGVAKQVRKARIDAARYEVKPDRTIAVVVGEPELTDANNPWPTADTADWRKKK